MASDELPQDVIDAMRLSPVGVEVAYTWGMVPSKRYDLVPHAVEASLFLMDALSPSPQGPRNRVLLLPVRHGKTTLARALCALHALTRPARDVILVSYSDEFASEHGEDIRKRVTELGPYFGVRIAPSSRKRSVWRIQHVDEGGRWHDGGQFKAAGAHGSITGRGAHLLVLDDLTRDFQEALSKVQMDSLWRWYQGTPASRLQSEDSAIIVCATRWSTMDLPGRLLEVEPDDWQALRLPALAEDDDPLGRQPGAALWPERYSAAWLAHKRDSTDEDGGAAFDALYQNSPRDASNAVFAGIDLDAYSCLRQGRTLHYPGAYSEPDSNLRHRFATLDPAITGKDTGDNTGLLLFGINRRGDLVCLEDLTARMRGTTDILPAMHRLASRFPGLTFFIESTAHGAEVVRAARRMAARTGVSLQVREVSPEGKDKVVRAHLAVPHVTSGRVYFVRDTCGKLFDELRSFPGRYDDRVDCLVYAVQVYAEMLPGLNAGESARIMREVVARDRQRHPTFADVMGSGVGYSDLALYQPGMPDGSSLSDAHPDDRPPMRRARGRERWAP